MISGRTAALSLAFLLGAAGVRCPAETLYESDFKNDFKTWKPYQNVVKSGVGEDGVVSVESGARLGGVFKSFNAPAGGMFELKVVFTGGNGRCQLAVNGSTGFAYSGEITLSGDSAREASMRYFDEGGNFSAYVYSLENQPASFKIAKITLSRAEPMNLSDSDITLCKMEAEDYPGGNSVMLERSDASGGRAVSGRRWYFLARVPTPATSKPFYVYARVMSPEGKSARLCVYRDGQLLGGAVIPAEKKWSWTRLGPFRAEAAMPELALKPDGDAAFDVLLDCFAISTNPLVLEAELEKGE